MAAERTETLVVQVLLTIVMERSETLVVQVLLTIVMERSEPIVVQVLLTMVAVVPPLFAFRHGQG